MTQYIEHQFQYLHTCKICSAFIWGKMQKEKKYTCEKVNLHLFREGANLHPGVNFQICLFTFAYMQLCSHSQIYTRVQIFHICRIYTPWVNTSKRGFTQPSITSLCWWRWFKHFLSWERPQHLSGELRLSTVLSWWLLGHSWHVYYTLLLKTLSAKIESI